MQVVISAAIAVASAVAASEARIPDASLYDEVSYDEVTLRPDTYLTGTRALVIKGATFGWDAATRLSP